MGTSIRISPHCNALTLKNERRLLGAADIASLFMAPGAVALPVTKHMRTSSYR